MPLSCSCDEWDGDGVGWIVPNDFSELKTKKARRCKSCRALIKPNSQVLEFKRIRYPNSEIELKIYSEYTELPMASWYLCGDCGEMFMNFDDLGFCVNPDENMKDLLELYQNEFIRDNGLFRKLKGE